MKRTLFPENLSGLIFISVSMPRTPLTQNSGSSDTPVWLITSTIVSGLWRKGRKNSRITTLHSSPQIVSGFNHAKPIWQRVNTLNIERTQQTLVYEGALGTSNCVVTTFNYPHPTKNCHWCTLYPTCITGNGHVLPSQVKTTALKTDGVHHYGGPLYNSYSPSSSFVECPYPSST